MPSFVRGNALVISATFTPTTGTDQPTSALARLQFVDLNGVKQNVSVPMTEGDDNLWTGTWDTSAAGDGTVSWVVYGTGSLEAAAQGQFQIEANAANTL